MDSFDSLEELVEERKRHFHMLIKFGSKENLEKLQHGEIYMKNLKYYNELEEKEESGKPDKYDGKWRMSDSRIQLSDPKTNDLIAEGTAQTVVLSFGYEKYPIYCLFSYDFRNCGSFITDSEKNICTIHTSFSDEQRKKLGKGLGEYALIILNTEDFLQRIKTAFEAEGIEYLLGKVQYNTGNSIERVESILQDNRNIAFNKDADDFSYQQELRYFITNRPVEDHLIVQMDSLEDISRLVSTEELLKLKIEISQEFKNNILT